MGLPVLRLFSSFMHAVTNTPAELLAAFARFPNNASLPRVIAGSASASHFSRPAQCSLMLRPACSPSPLQNPLHQRLQPLRYLHGCSSCYRPERKLPGGIRTRWKTAPFHGAQLPMINLPCLSNELMHSDSSFGGRPEIIQTGLEQ